MFLFHLYAHCYLPFKVNLKIYLSLQCIYRSKDTKIIINFIIKTYKLKKKKNYIIKYSNI